jgi:hypothetical protein
MTALRLSRRQLSSAFPDPASASASKPGHDRGAASGAMGRELHPVEHIPRDPFGCGATSPRPVVAMYHSAFAGSYQ